MVKIRKVRTTSSKIVLEVDSKRTFKRQSSKEKKLVKLSREILSKFQIANAELCRLREENRKLKELKVDQGEVAKLRTKLNFHRNDRDDKDSKTIRGALERARRGTQDPLKMQQRTKALLKEAGKWEEVKKLYSCSKRSTPIKSISLSMMR